MVDKVWTAYSYMDENRNGIIELHGTNQWSTAWSITAYFNNAFSRYDLYPLTKNGIGTAFNSGNSLRVIIPQPPRYLTLNASDSVGSFSKKFQFVNSGIEASKELIYAPSITLQGPTSFVTPAFILFNDQPNLAMNDSAYLAKFLNSSNKVIGYAFGERFTRVSNGVPAFEFGGIVFPRVFMFNAPSSSDEFTFVLSVSGTVFSRRVQWNGTVFTGPSSQRFQPTVNHLFQMERIASSF